jgi:hypothetical protein
MILNPRLSTGTPLLMPGSKFPFHALPRDRYGSLKVILQLMRDLAKSGAGIAGGMWLKYTAPEDKEKMLR